MEMQPPSDTDSELGTLRGVLHKEDNAPKWHLLKHPETSFS